MLDNANIVGGSLYTQQMVAHRFIADVDITGKRIQVRVLEQTLPVTAGAVTDVDITRGGTGYAP